MFGFEIRWPEPFPQEWKRAGRTFPSATEAANAMAEYMAVSFDNDCQMLGRIVRVEN